MTHKLHRSLQALALIALSLFLAGKIIGGTLTWYINLRFLPLTVLGIVLLAVMAQAIYRQGSRADEDHHGHEHEHKFSFGGLAVVLIPLAIGILIPARPLDSAAVASKGVNATAPLVNSASSTSFEVAADQRNVLDWLRIFNYETDLAPYLGQTANITGFVYYDERLPAGQFLVSRFVISCCAADGFAVGVPTQWEGKIPAENTWVQVRGPMQAAPFAGRNSPLLLAETLETIREPEQPYLFP